MQSRTPFTSVLPALALGTLAALLTPATPAHAAIYSAVAAAPFPTNPSAPWSFYSSDSLGSAPLLLSHYTNDPSHPIWDNAGGIPNWSGMQWSSTRYNSGTVMLGPDWLTLDPQSRAVFVRFTSPADDTWHLTGSFAQGDVAAHAHGIAILQDYNTSLLQQSWSGTTTVPFDLTLPLPAGHTVDFITYSTGDYAYLSTALSATAISLPEPSLALLALTLPLLPRRRR